MTGFGIVFHPLLPAPFLWAAACLVLFFALAAIRTGARGRWLRPLAVLAVLLAAANPHIDRETFVAERDILLVIADRSPSNRLDGREEEVSRALEAVRVRAESLGLELRLIETPRRTGRTDLLTPLAAALAEVPRDRLSAILVLSDGLIEDGAETGPVVAAGVPVHVLLSGDPLVPDRRLRILRAPEYGIVDRPLAVTLMVEDRNLPVTESAMLTISRPGSESEQRLIAVGQPVEITLTPASRGMMSTLFEIAPGEGESYLENNRAILDIEAVRDRLRVLLVSGEPHPGERVWRDTLKSDPAVDLVHFTILRLPSSQDPTPTAELSLIPFPTERLFAEQLSDFDLVIFDRYSLRGVLESRYFENLRNYVEQGGAILVSNGPEYAGSQSLYRTALAPVLPVAPSGEVRFKGFRPAVTALGRRHPVTRGLDEVTAGRWFRSVPGRAIAGDLLMTAADETPLLVLARVGEGRIATLMSDHVWLWARNIEGGGPYEELLRRLVHWLMKEPDLEEEALGARGLDGEIEIMRRSLSADGATVEVEAPDGTRRTIVLTPGADGLATARIPAAEDGFYRLRDDRFETTVAIGPANGPERMRYLPEAGALAPLAEATGGTIRWLKDGSPEFRRTIAGAKAGGRTFIGLPRREAMRTIAIEEHPLLPPALWLLLLLTLLALTWLRESR